MKKLMFLFLMAFSVSACSLTDDATSNMVLMPVESVVMPDSYSVNQVATIKVKYRRPSDCHIFNGFYNYAEANAFTKTLCIQAVKFNQNNCLDDSQNLYEVPLEFKPVVAGEYLFRFWTGNMNGSPQYIEENIVVQ